MSTGDDSRAEAADLLRSEVGAARRRQRLRWGLAIIALLGLLSVSPQAISGTESSGGLFLYAAVVVALALAVSTLMVITSLGQLEVVRKLSATEIAWGGVVEAWLIVHNHKPFPAAGLLWRDQIEAGLDVEGPTSCTASLGGGCTRKLTYRLHSTRRGLFRVGPTVVEAAGPFGLMRRFLLDRQASFITVLPRTVEIGKGWPLGHRPIHEVPRRRSLFEDPSRFQGIREYRRGDSLRRVHWRATARSGRLQVKLFEPAVLEGMLVVVDMARDVHPATRRAKGAQTEHREELTVTAAASLVEFVIAGGQSVALLSNGADAAERYPEDWQGGTFRRLEEALETSDAGRKITGFRPVEVEPGKGGWQRERLRTVLARLVPAPGPELPELLLGELPRLPRSLVLMIVTPRVDAALAGATATLRRAGIEVGVVWIGAGAEAAEARDAAIDGVPVYAVAGEDDLELLGGRQL